jgi:hypothetical protein
MRKGAKRWPTLAMASFVGSEENGGAGSGAVMPATPLRKKWQSSC